MKIDIAAFAREAELALRKIRSVADAVSGSPVTASMEKWVPGLSELVADAEETARVAGLLGGLAPMLPALATVAEGLGAMASARPMDAADPASLARERELEG
jgi:hypothetical protein